MKEITACLRPTTRKPVIRELERAGARGIIVIRVDAIGAAVAEETDQHHFVHEYDKKYSAVAKREIICADTGAPRFVGIIQRLAHPGARGDDRIHVSIVNEATNIRTSAHSEAAFCTPLSGARNP